MRTTVAHPGIGTGISEASKTVPMFPFAAQGGNWQASEFLFSTEELGHVIRNRCWGVDVVRDVDGVAGVLRITWPSDAAVGIASVSGKI